jgi:hypothetical protein
MDFAREDIYNALFGLLKDLTGIQNAARRFITWDQLQPEELPYLMQIETRELAEVNGRGIPVRWCLTVEALVVVESTKGDSPYPIINPLIDVIEKALFKDPNLGAETLGGKVSQVRIKGAVEKGQDKLGTKGWFIVPLEVVLPA